MSNLGVNEMLALLDRLESAIRTFASREEKLNGEYRSRSSAAAKAFEKATEEHTSQLAERIAAAEAVFETEKQKLQSKFERRKRRITQAHLICTQQVEEGTDRAGRRQRKIQESAMETERLRDTELANAAAELERLQATLAETREGFVLLEKNARSAFRGYGKFRRLLSPHRQWPEVALPPDEHKLLDEFRRLEAGTRDELNRFKTILLPRVFAFVPMWLLTILLLLAFGVSVPLLHLPYPAAGAALAILWAVFFAIHQVGKFQAGPAAGTIAGHLAKARRWHDLALEKVGLWYQQEKERIQKEFEEANRSLNQEWKQSVRAAMDTRGARAQKVDEKGFRVLKTNERIYHAKLGKAQSEHTSSVTQLREAADAQARQFADTHAEKMARLTTEHETRWQTLQTDWEYTIRPIHETIRAANATADELFPDWQQPVWKQRALPEEFKNAAKFGRMEVDVAKLVGVAPKDKRLALPFPASFSVPLLLKYPGQGSIIFETAKFGGDEAIAAINNIIFRLLSVHPPGKLSFTIFDPVGLGQNFAGLMHLADYEESHINSRIWTQTGQLEEKLAELNEHMEKVIQMYLRNEYATIAEYNAQAGTIAEKYHFLVIADFPVNFSETAIRRLINIATSGARCGVFTLIHWDRRQALPQGFVPDELRKNSVCVVRAESGFRLAADQPEGTRLLLDVPPKPEFVTDFLHLVGESGKDSNRVEVPFEQVAPPPDQVWTEETTDELRVPIGRSGATKLQYLAIGKGTRQHALIAGKTGSGKSTLFHVIITNLATWCSPEEVEFYLVDFKKGVEFKCYATRRLPHARVMAIESDRAFGLSVLERVDAELRRRGDLFRELGVQDIAGYKKAGGTEPMPRVTAAD